MDAVFSTNGIYRFDFPIDVINVPGTDLYGMDVSRVEELISREEVESFLEELSKTPYEAPAADGEEDQGEFVGLVDTENPLHGNPLFFALSPVKMALHIGRYDLVEGLLVNGHKLTNGYSFGAGLNDSAYTYRNFGGTFSPNSIENIDLTKQLLLIKDIPDNVLDILLEEESEGLLTIDDTPDSVYFDGIDSTRLYRLMSHPNIHMISEVMVRASAQKVNRSTILSILKSNLTARLMYIKELIGKEDGLEEIFNIIIGSKALVENATYVGEQYDMRLSKPVKSLLAKQYMIIFKFRLELIKLLSAYPGVVKLIITHMLLDMTSIEAVVDEIKRVVEFEGGVLTKEFAMEYDGVIMKYRKELSRLIDEYNLEFNSLLDNLSKCREDYIFGVNADYTISQYYSHLYSICAYSEISMRRTDCKLSYKNMKLFKDILSSLMNFYRGSLNPGIEQSDEAMLNALVAAFEHIDYFTGNPVKSKRCKDKYKNIVMQILHTKDEGLIEALLSRNFMPGEALETVKEIALAENYYNILPMILAYKE